jgi:hypothetical protein
MGVELRIIEGDSCDLVPPPDDWEGVGVEIRSGVSWNGVTEDEDCSGEDSSSTISSSPCRAGGEK